MTCLSKLPENAGRAALPHPRHLINSFQSKIHHSSPGQLEPASSILKSEKGRFGRIVSSKSEWRVPLKNIGPLCFKLVNKIK